MYAWKNKETIQRKECVQSRAALTNDTKLAVVNSCAIRQQFLGRGILKNVKRIFSAVEGAVGFVDRPT